MNARGLLLAAALAGEARAAGLEDVVSYDEGLRVETKDDRFAFHLEWRLQYRLALPFDPNPEEVGDLDVEAGPPTFEVRRARLKFDGHAGPKWLRYAGEVEMAKPRLLDGRLMLGPKDRFEVWIGQYKAGYGRERQGSSGAQQFVDRSLSNGFFTIDRQVGVEARWQDPGVTRLGASLGVYAGNGSLELGRDRRPMLMGRLQWHPQGKVEDAAQSDLAFSEELVSTWTIGALWTQGPYTAFGSSGGGQLPGFEDGDDDRYVLVQGLFDASVRWRGLSAQGEANVKGVTDTRARERTTLIGGYAQVGWLPHGVFPAFPAAYEIALRGSWVDPEVGASGDALGEVTLAANAYVDGHRVKVTGDASRFSGGGKEAWRGRLQLDVSF